MVRDIDFFDTQGLVFAFCFTAQEGKRRCLLQESGYLSLLSPASLWGRQLVIYVFERNVPKCGNDAQLDGKTSTKLYNVVC